MELQYIAFNGIPDKEMLAGILKLHTSIFGASDDLIGRMKEKAGLHINLALDMQQVVGYKIGYALNREQFYSWLGGVDTAYRKQGVALKLMDQQHKYIKESGYNAIRTHTKNKWRAMLVVNIKSGFDVIGTYTDGEGEPKIILEKKL